MIAVLAVILFIIYDHYSAFPYIHEEVYNEQDDWYITIEDKIVVPPTILDYKIKLPYMFGIRLDANEYQCDVGVRTMLDDKRKYFILHLLTGDYMSFDSFEAFDKKIQQMNVLLEDYNLNYTMFKHVWNKYNQDYKKYKYYSLCDMDNPL